MQNKKESTKALTSALVASLIVMSTIAVTASIIMTIQSASASAVDDQKDQRCLPRSENNGKDNAGNEHYNADGSFSQDKNVHDPGTPKGNPHDRCVGS